MLGCESSHGVRLRWALTHGGLVASEVATSSLGCLFGYQQSWEGKVYKQAWDSEHCLGLCLAPGNSGHGAGVKVGLQTASWWSCLLFLCPGGSLCLAVHLAADVHRGLLPLSHLPLPGSYTLLVSSVSRTTACGQICVL